MLVTINKTSYLDPTNYFLCQEHEISQSWLLLFSGHILHIQSINSFHSVQLLQLIRQCSEPIIVI